MVSLVRSDVREKESQELRLRECKHIMYNFDYGGSAIRPAIRTEERDDDSAIQPSVAVKSWRNDVGVLLL